MTAILTFDIGGTQSRAGIFTLKDGSPLLLRSAVCSTQEYSAFADVYSTLLGRLGPEAQSSCSITVIAAAGPVEENLRARLPLVSFDIDAEELERAGNAGNIFVVNDFFAEAYAAVGLCGDVVINCIEGCPPDSGQQVAVIGAGTGLGKAIVAQTEDSKYIVLTSEGCHAPYPFQAPSEVPYQEFLLKRTGKKYITYNDVVSGPGFAYLYEYMTGAAVGPSDIGDLLEADGEFLWAASLLYARAARNFALESLCTGGMYITGGVAKRTPALITHPEFRREFQQSDLMAELLLKIPVWLVTENLSGLWGAAFIGMAKLADTK